MIRFPHFPAFGSFIPRLVGVALICVASTCFADWTVNDSSTLNNILYSISDIETALSPSQGGSRVGVSVGDILYTDRQILNVLQFGFSDDSRTYESWLHRDFSFITNSLAASLLYHYILTNQVSGISNVVGKLFADNTLYHDVSTNKMDDILQAIGDITNSLALSNSYLVNVTNTSNDSVSWGMLATNIFLSNFVVDDIYTFDDYIDWIKVWVDGSASLSELNSLFPGYFLWNRRFSDYLSMIYPTRYKSDLYDLAGLNDDSRSFIDSTLSGGTGISIDSPFSVYGDAYYSLYGTLDTRIAVTNFFEMLKNRSLFDGGTNTVEDLVSQWAEIDSDISYDVEAGTLPNGGVDTNKFDSYSFPTNLVPVSSSSYIEALNSAADDGAASDAASTAWLSGMKGKLDSVGENLSNQALISDKRFEVNLGFLNDINSLDTGEVDLNIHVDELLLDFNLSPAAKDKIESFWAVMIAIFKIGTCGWAFLRLWARLCGDSVASASADATLSVSDSV